VEYSKLAYEMFGLLHGVDIKLHVHVRARSKPPMNSQLEVLSVVEQGSEHALREVIRKGVRVDVNDEEGSSSLLYAAAHGREDIVRILLEVQLS